MTTLALVALLWVWKTYGLIYAIVVILVGGILERLGQHAP